MRVSICKLHFTLILTGLIMNKLYQEKMKKYHRNEKVFSKRIENSNKGLFRNCLTRTQINNFNIEEKDIISIV